jgi:two-component system, NtrC family, response regulator HydG
VYDRPVSTRQPPGSASDATEVVAPATGPAVGLRVVVSGVVPAPPPRSIGPGGVTVGSGPDNDLVLDDRRVSRHHLRLSPHPGGVQVADLGSRNGTFLGRARIKQAVAQAGAVLEIADLRLAIEPDVETAEVPPSPRRELCGLIGRSAAMRRLFTLIERVAPSDYTVLIEGETGTGKEVVARALHELSPRRARPLVVLDCAAISSGLVESALFGHVRGAFTGADRDRDGALARADGGTLFIDELNSMPADTQAKLLRAIETRRFLPVGGEHERAVDLRVVAAANVPLAGEVAAGRFRADLFYRLSVIRIELPPLRSRLEDVPALVQHFLRAAGRETEVGGHNLDLLLGSAWPGNVRELRNTIERALALAGPGPHGFDDLPISRGDAAPTMAWPIALDLPFKEAKDQLVGAFERVYVTQLLARAGGNLSEAARRAGLSRRHLFDVVRKHGLARDDDDGDGA